MTIPKEHILLVDDEEGIRCVLNKGLSMRGFECDEAENGDRALEKLEEKPADLVIMDINMPGRSGVGSPSGHHGAVPGDRRHHVERISEATVIAECIKKGAQDYISKPFRFEQVLQSVNGTLDKRRVALDIQRYLQEMGQYSGETGEEPRRLFLGAIEGLVNTLESCDAYTADHSHKVTDLA
jgi:DNA-binding NtrC family response regulator